MNRKRRRELMGNCDETLLYVIRPNDITYGYSNNNAAPPDYISANSNRGIYAPFDILLPNYERYIITASAATNDLYFTVQFFTHKQLEKVQDGEYLGAVYFTSGWRNGSYQFNLPILGNEEVAGCRIVIAKGSHQDQVVDSSLSPSFEIRRVV